MTVEKYLKSTWADNAVPRVHKISELLARTPADIPEPIAEDLTLLDRFYIPTRYPDAIPGSIDTGLPDPEDAASAITSVMSLKAHLVKS